MTYTQATTDPFATCRSGDGAALLAERATVTLSSLRRGTAVLYDGRTGSIHGVVRGVVSLRRTVRHTFRDCATSDVSTETCSSTTAVHVRPDGLGSVRVASTRTRATVTAVPFLSSSRSLLGCDGDPPSHRPYLGPPGNATHVLPRLQSTVPLELFFRRAGVTVRAGVKLTADVPDNEPALPWSSGSASLAALVVFRRSVSPRPCVPRVRTRGVVCSR